MAKVGRGFQVGLSWVPLMEGRIPPKAISIGDRIFVARGRIDNELIPGKYVEKYATCYVSHGGVEHELSECEILCDTSISGDCCAPVALRLILNAFVKGLNPIGSQSVSGVANDKIHQLVEFASDIFDYEWKEDSNGSVPKHAIVAGIAEDGEPLFVCKAKINGEKCVGKIHYGHSCGYLPHGGVEHSVDDYKVLCLRKK
ncbi:hypothetical protein ACTXT7_014550 [Hymenolepis weldensis]